MLSPAAATEESSSSAVLSGRGSTAIASTLPTSTGRATHAERDAARVWVHRLIEQTGVPWCALSVQTGELLAHGPGAALPYVPFEVRLHLDQVTQLAVREPEQGLVTVALPIPHGQTAGVVLVGYCLSSVGVRPQELVIAAADRDWSEEQFHTALQQLPVASRGTLERLVGLAVQRLTGNRRESLLQQEINALSQQIDYTYEEISLLHCVTQNLQLSTTAVPLAELCLKRLHGLIDATAHMLVLEDAQGQVHFLQQGRPPIDEAALGRLLARFEGHDWSLPLVKNHATRTLIGADFPGLESFVIVPIGEGSYRRGWIFSANLSGEREFGTVEASLLSSIANILSTHIRNIELFNEHDELLLSFVRSLVSTLDAKDPYTRGHSERVALIARRLGEQLHLPTGDLDDIYLSGLLHDIGKIGVDDRILRKPDQLTEDEFRQIQEHPMIGYNILLQLKSLHHILPGVRHHHENYNGRGYPDKLRGEEIPLMARIIAVADSYDAIASDRPYRKGMPLERLEEIFRRGSGEQWDSRVIDAYFAARDDIQKLCANYTSEGGNLLQERGPDRLSAIGNRTRLRH